MSLFQSVPQNISIKKQAAVIQDPILYKNFEGSLEKADIIFLTEKPYSKREVLMFRDFLYKNKVKSLNWSLVSSVIIDPGKLVNNIVDFYCNNKSNLKSIIPKNSKIVSMGRSIYSITESDDLREDDFIDFLTDKTYFYTPELQSYIFPVHEYYRWIDKDNFELKWFFNQIVNCKEFSSNKRIKSYVFHDIEDTSKFFKEFNNESIVAWDIETDSLNWKEANIGYISFAFNSYEGYLLKWKDINKEELENFLQNKKQILANGKYDCKCLVRNGIRREALHIDYDIWNMQHIWKEDNSHNGLKAGSWRHTFNGGYENELKHYIKQNKIKNYLDIPYHIMRKYATPDAIVTFQVYEEVYKLIETMDKKYPLNNGWSLKRYLEEIVMPSVNMFLDVELAGWYINYEELKLMSKELQEEIKIIEEEIYSVLNKERESFNIYSTEQLSSLIEELGWKIEERGKAGQPLTHEACLQRWKKQGHKEAELLLKLREKTALMNTFVGKEEDKSGFFQYLVKEGKDYKVYPSIFPMLADSGRSKHRDPNGANIPSHGEGGKFIRRMFQPPTEEYVFLSADASGLQLRIAAILSKDPMMTDIFKNQNGDMHSLTAAGVFGNILSYRDNNGEINVIKGIKEGYKPLGFNEFTNFRKVDEKVKEYRFKSKGINFGALFGAVAQTIKKQSIESEWTEEACEEYIELNNLQDSLLKHEIYYKEKNFSEEDICFHSKTLTVAEDIRKKFFITYSGLEKWIEESRNFAKSNGYIRSIYGAFRRLPYLLYSGKDTDKSKYAGLLNICLNSPVQNIESVLMNRWLCHFNTWRKENNKKSYIFGAIHDAGEFMFHKDEIEEGYNFLKKDFETNYSEYDGIPMELEANKSDYWGTYKTDNWELWDMGKEL